MTDDDTITLSREALRHRLADLYCVALHHEHTGTPECRGTQAADQVISELLAPPTTALREQVHALLEGDDDDYSFTDGVLSTVAEAVAALPSPTPEPTFSQHSYIQGYEAARKDVIGLCFTTEEA